MLLNDVSGFLLNTAFRMRHMTALDKDIQIITGLGGPSKVAELLNLPKKGGQQRVQNWLSRGIPAAIKVERPDLFMPELASFRTVCATSAAAS